MQGPHQQLSNLSTYFTVHKLTNTLQQLSLILQREGSMRIDLPRLAVSFCFSDMQQARKEEKLDSLALQNCIYSFFPQSRI